MFKYTIFRLWNDFIIFLCFSSPQCNRKMTQYCMYIICGLWESQVQRLSWIPFNKSPVAVCIPSLTTVHYALYIPIILSKSPPPQSSSNLFLFHHAYGLRTCICALCMQENIITCIKYDRLQIVTITLETLCNRVFIIESMKYRKWKIRYNLVKPGFLDSFRRGSN